MAEGWLSAVAARRLPRRSTACLIAGNGPARHPVTG